MKEVWPKVAEYFKLSILSGNSSSKKSDVSIVDLTQDSVGNSLEEREDINAFSFSELLHSAILKGHPYPLPSMIYSIFKREYDAF